MAEALICAQNWLRSSFYQFKDFKFNEKYKISEDVLQGIFQSFLSVFYNLFCNILLIVF